MRLLKNQKEVNSGYYNLSKNSLKSNFILMFFPKII